MAGSNRRPSRYKHAALPTELMELYESHKLSKSVRGGIRTHEAEAVDLKSTPFDRSGTLAECPPWGSNPRPYG